jgi:alpha-D-xyloside xylohydrolase
MKKILFLSLIAASFCANAQNVTINKLADNAVRIRCVGNGASNLPDWIYEGRATANVGTINAKATDKSVKIDGLEYEFCHRLSGDTATLTFQIGNDEFLYGLGQFQDGYNNIASLPRRLTQVNTQISVPVLISNRGYGIIWNNYAKTEFNMPTNRVALLKTAAEGEKETVDVTSTEGGKKETRQKNIFEAEIDVPADGNYALLLDVGQKMARRHNLKIDGKTVIEMQNLWLPPTASKIVSISKGKHTLTAELTDNDRPVLYYGLATKQTSFSSYPSDAVDYTIIKGTPDEIIATYRKLTGTAPLMPAWALGYIHCRERFHSQQEIKETADRFISEKIPLDVIVQDWQYWGKNGWNSMVFDADNYPDPKALTDYLHSQNIRMMLSVWSKIDKNSVVGKEMEKNGYYIPNTDWIDFFNPDAAAAYWKNFSEKLLPTGIDAWWQDATEPENDDLDGRIVGNGSLDGNRVRNVYPMLVNKTVYEGLRKDQPNKRPMILTRSGFLGIQRYGSALWSGDVGNDWETLRRQITGGLGFQAAGVPWWTYDAGGFFRPYDQYTNQDYINRMLRWIQLSVYLPLMRVHGYMSDTEPWKYGTEAQANIRRCIDERKQLFPYIYSNAAEVAFNGSTLMRPLVFDFYNDPKALEQKYEYMFGKALLISPVTEPDVTEWETYLPENEGGWYDVSNNYVSYKGGQTVKTKIDNTKIPIFAKGGSIVLKKGFGDNIDINVFWGGDAEFVYYEDDGESLAYQTGNYSKTLIKWDNAAGILTIKPLGGNPATHTFKIMVCGYEGHVSTKHYSHDFKSSKFKTVDYKGKELKINVKKMK